jgi:predicted O-methyltransferase YrrM
MKFDELLDINLINKINLNEHFNKFSLCNDFYMAPGNQHYKLLAYLSSLFNNVNIVEIGTHLGESALALSYNKNNTIYTFDIVDKVSQEKKIDNIKFIIDDIINNIESRNKWKDIILSSSFIFLDVDPHNGTMEYDFYLYLKENNYNGFVICDDIWYFKEMRDNFWYKIPYEYRYDISHFGHWSGTGIFTFNQNFKFHKNNNLNWTLVTAYFNLTKCSDASEEINKRDKSYYLSHSLSTLNLPYNLVVYCDNESYNEIVRLRPEFLRDKTFYKIMEFDDFMLNNKRFNAYRDIINENRRINPYNFDNRNTASYYLFCMSRYIMLREIIDLNPFKSEYFCWINFCIERMGYTNLKYLDEALAVKREKFSTCYIDYIPNELILNTKEYFKWGRCSMCSGFFTGNKEYMYKVCGLILDKFLYYLSLGYGHADEQLYSPVYFENPGLFEHYYGDYIQMITDYKYIYEAPENPIRNFINNSFINKNFNKCIECSEFILKSVKLNKCQINDYYFNFLMEKYLISKLNTKFYFNNDLIIIDDELKYLYDMIVKPLLDKGNNKECYTVCEIILEYINKNSINPSNEFYFLIYFSYYVSSFYFKRDKSEEIVNKIFSLCKENKSFNNQYKNNKDFYDSQFKFVNYKKNNTKLAYYTCFFGSQNNYSFLIPPVPSKEYDCYYFTNNKDIYDKLQSTNFISIFIDDIPIYDDHNKDTMSSKKYRCNPFDIDSLNKYDYLCWFDNKLKVYDEQIENMIYELDKSDKSIIFTRHPYFEKYNSIWDEFNLSMNVEKYKNEEINYVNYINKMIKNGYNQYYKDGFLCGGINIRKNNEISKKFGLEWFNNILECGIQDQLTLFFISQNYIEHIKILEYKYFWKYFYE